MLVNIFGGIVRCDLIAEGIVAAIKDVGVNVPVVVRLEGNNAELGSQILADSGVEVESLNDLDHLSFRPQRRNLPVFDYQAQHYCLQA